MYTHGYYDYKGQLCRVVELFTAEVKGYPKLYAACELAHEGTCFIAEWSSLKARPLHVSPRDWEEQHEPIEYFGSTIVAILERNGYHTMRDIDPTNLDAIAKLPGIGDKYMEIIKMGWREWNDLNEMPAYLRSGRRYNINETEEDI